ncbi:cardioacceleratory peptide receptor-like [Anopheles aquasalis]|uniref:cardioacceleratory peptide receptor-like n=1 Tax=Anopheles aquasalis TaxID=42839 RepID=UPI00215A88AE|nr:cardioacceleratory peptide receptor-like [Anopheles aquasalis]
MLSILIWASLRHLSAQCNAEPYYEPFGGAEPTTLQPTTSAATVATITHHHHHHQHHLLFVAYANVCGIELSKALANGSPPPCSTQRGNLVRYKRSASTSSEQPFVDLRFVPKTGSDKAELDTRWAYNGTPTPRRVTSRIDKEFESRHHWSDHGAGEIRADAVQPTEPAFRDIGATNGANDVMNITPALSQVLLAPSATSGFGLAILMATNAVADENGTRGEEINSFYFYETVQSAVTWVLFAVIVLGNSAVLVALTLNRTRKSRMNFFIKQLAIADLSVGLLSVLPDNIWRMTVEWRAGNTACKTIRFMQACVTYASTYVLVALSIDRYDAITHPMNFSGCWNRARKLMVAAWSLSIAFSLPIVYFFEERLIQGTMQCWIDLVDDWRWQVYMCWISGSLFVVPALIISACYAIIVRTIWAKGTVLGPIDRTQNGIGDLACRRASSRGIIPRAKVKTVKMTIVIVVVFVLCWSPYIVFDLLQVFKKIPRTQTNVAIATFIQSLAPLNSAANPLIYCLFSTQVCRMIKRLPPFRWLWSAKWCCKQHDTGTLPIGNGSAANATTGGRLFHNHRNSNSDSMRTLTTSLTVSRRSCLRPAARVVIVERPKTQLAISAV